MSDTTQTITAQTALLQANAARGSWRIRVALAFLAIYVIWGSTYLAIRYAVETIPPLYTAGFRHLVAGSVLLIWALAKGQRPTWAQVRASVVIGFFFFLLGHGSLHWAEQFVPSGLASLLIAIEPIIVFLMSSAAARVSPDTSEASRSMVGGSRFGRPVSGPPASFSSSSAMAAVPCHLRYQ